MACLFLFSSRRRHTRCLSDWSSDVCSSDLEDDACQVLDASSSPTRTSTTSARCTSSFGPAAPACWPTRSRSEERRVGKECKSGGSPWQYKKKKQHTSR